MLIGYARISKADGSQVLDLQHDALAEAGVRATNLYEDRASGKKDDHPGLAACLKTLRKGMSSQGSRMKDCDPLRGSARKKPRLAKPRFDRPTSNWSERISV